MNDEIKKGGKMTEYKLYKDRGARVTQLSLKYFEKNKNKLGKIWKIEVGFEPIRKTAKRNYNMVLKGTKGEMWLSGCNCGYGGEGPHGTAKILEFFIDKELFGKQKKKFEEKFTEELESWFPGKFGEVTIKKMLMDIISKRKKFVLLFKESAPIGFIVTKELDLIPNCPKCGSENVVGCKGGTCLVPNQEISWICEDCLREW